MRFFHLARHTAVLPPYLAAAELRHDIIRKLFRGINHTGRNGV